MFRKLRSKGDNDVAEDRDRKGPQQQENKDGRTESRPSTSSSSNASLDSSFNDSQTDEETSVAPCIESMKKYVRKVTNRYYRDLNSPFPDPGEGPRRDLKLDEIFTNLIVYRGRANYDFSGDRAEQLNEYFKADKNLRPTRPGDIFDVEKRTILVVGRPGIGKTMFSTKILRDWASDNLFTETQKSQMDFKVAFLIKLANFTWKQINLRELLDHSEYSTALSDDLWNYIRHNPDRVLLIFDEFDKFCGRLSIVYNDRYSSNEEEERMHAIFLLKKIVSGKILTGATVLMTTRANAVRCIRSLHFDKTVEILGFSTELVYDFVEKFTREKDKAETIKQHITSNLNLLSFCYVPANCFIICSCLSELLANTIPTILPIRTTEIYSIAVKMFYFRHGESAYQRFFLKPFKEHPVQLKKKFTDLGKIAFDGIGSGRLIFESHEVCDLKGSCLIHCLSETQYCFLHLTIQEFLAAKYLVDKLSSEDLRGFVSDHIHHGAWKVVMQFVAGLLAEKELQSTDIFSDLLPSKTVTKVVDSAMSKGREERAEGVPLDIQARGPLATEVYNRELKEGQGYARRVPIMIIGQARTGKTSLKKSLKGELFDPCEGSTEGIETDPSYFKVTTDIWRTGRNGEDTEIEPEFLLDRQLAQKLFKGLKEKERLEDPSTSGTRPSVKDFQVVEPSKAKSSVKDFQEVEPSEANLPPTESSRESRSNRFEPSLQDSRAVENAKAPSLPTKVSVELEEFKTSSLVTEQIEGDPSPQDAEDHQKVPENVVVWVEKLLKENKEFMEGDDMYSVIWDFGGQSVFYDTHPIFLTEKAIYILTCDLSCDPYQKADPPVKQGMYEDIEDTDCQKTNFDYLDFWMSSIYSLVSNNTNRQETSSSETFPAVFLACTHADKPYTKKGNPSRKIFGDLRKIYGSLLKDVFLVDNTKSGSNDECEGVKELREKVRSVAAKLPQMEQEIPLKWLRYEKVLYLMRKEGREKISIEDARKIASDKCGINGEENFRTALNFLHDQKVLINFDESPGLERMVILNPQWLVDVFKEVITFKGFNHNDKNFESLWWEFEESGILKRELLDHVWKRFIDDQNTCESLIEMMEKFSLLCQWPSEGNTERYLVPSMLKSKPASKFPNPGVETPSLFVKFKSRRVPQGGVPQGREPPGRVPPGLFSRLLLLFHHWVQDQVKIKHKKRNQPKPCSNYAMFRIVPEDDISAALLRYSSLIEIVFVLEGDFLDERRLNISHGIHQQLGVILEGMRKEFSWLKHMDYELCVACSVCCGEKSSSSCGPHENRGCDCLHLFSEEELKNPVCERENARTSCRVAKEKFHLWFSSQVELEEFLRSFGGSAIHDEIINDVNAMDLLARGLDKRIILGEQELQRNLSYWKHLAEHFKVLREDMMMWQYPHERSPSRKIFELLDSEDPGFSVKKLKQKLKIIKRNDLVEKLKGTATLQDLFENKIYKSICVQLDYNGSWQTLGLELGISREKRESIAIDSSTSYFQAVLEIVRTRKPYLTVKEMRDFFEKEKRRDVCNVLPEGGTIQTLLEDIECLESLSVLLDKESPVMKNWWHFARKFGVSLDQCNNLKPEALSPTKTLMEHIVQVEPKLTVKTLIEALKKIGRRDVVLELTKFFLGRSRTKQDANEKSISADEEVPKSP